MAEHVRVEIRAASDALPTGGELRERLEAMAHDSRNLDMDAWVAASYRPPRWSSAFIPSFLSMSWNPRGVKPATLAAAVMLDDSASRSRQ